MMATQARPYSILITDDDRASREALRSIVEPEGYSTLLASSGEEALRFLLDEDTAVILLDVHMPTIGGLETAALIRGRERTRNVPIIFLTASDSAGDLRCAERSWSGKLAASPDAGGLNRT